MRGALRGQFAASAGSRDEPPLEQERLDDIFERAGVFAQGGSQGFEPDGTQVTDDGADELRSQLPSLTIHR